MVGIVRGCEGPQGAPMISERRPYGVLQQPTANARNAGAAADAQGRARTAALSNRLPAVSNAPALAGRRCKICSGCRLRIEARAARSCTFSVPRQDGFWRANCAYGGQVHDGNPFAWRPAPTWPARLPTGALKVAATAAEAEQLTCWSPEFIEVSRLPSRYPRGRAGGTAGLPCGDAFRCTGETQADWDQHTDDRVPDGKPE